MSASQCEFDKVQVSEKDLSQSNSFQTKPIEDFKLHPIHSKIPSMNETERERFREDIKKVGILEPMKVDPDDDDLILDGSERYKNSRKVGLDRLPFEKAELNGQTRAEYIIRRNFQRRSLSKSQKAMTAAEMKSDFEKKAKERQGTRTDIQENFPGSCWGQSRDKVGSLCGVSGRSVNKAEKVLERNSNLAEKVWKGEVSLHKAHTQVSRKVEKRKREKKAENLPKPQELNRGELPLNKVIQGKAIEKLKQIPENSVHFVMFSPPYYQCRNYGMDDQIGLEDDYHDYIQNLVEVCRELKRVLRLDGSMWIVIDDTYSNGNSSIPRKSKMGLPHRLALALIDDGWIWREDVDWIKQILFQDDTTYGPAMPTGVEDRFAENTEDVYHFVQNQEYWFDLDAVRVPVKEKSKKRAKYPTSKFGESPEAPNAKLSKGGEKTDFDLNPKGKNPGNAWRINTAQNTEGHPASYPEKLVERPLKATCPPKVCSGCGTPYTRSKEDEWIPNCGCDADTEPGIALDPMCGMGKTIIAAKKFERSYVGIDLNPDYVELARERLE